MFQTFVHSLMSYFSIFLLLLDPWTLGQGWTALPKARGLNGSPNRPLNCTGCHSPIGRGEEVHRCLFHSRPFTSGSPTLVACGTQYHASCIRVGPPFRSRLTQGDKPGGLQYPSCMTILPFICESCIVRTQLGRELRPTLRDTRLLMFERMRQIDMAHEWSEATMEAYTWNLRRFYQFVQAYGIIDPFSFALPSSPPQHPSIPLYWNISRHTLEEHKRNGINTQV